MLVPMLNELYFPFYWHVMKNHYCSIRALRDGRIWRRGNDRTLLQRE
jgi:hypothetical protein